MRFVSMANKSTSYSMCIRLFINIPHCGLCCSAKVRQFVLNKRLNLDTETETVAKSRTQEQGVPRMWRECIHIWLCGIYGVQLLRNVFIIGYANQFVVAAAAYPKCLINCKGHPIKSLSAFCFALFFSLWWVMIYIPYIYEIYTSYIA